MPDLKSFLISLISDGGHRFVTLRIDASSKADAEELGNNAVEVMTPLIEEHYSKMMGPDLKPLLLKVRVTILEDTENKRSL